MISTNEYEFKLVSGVSASVTELTGDEQRLLTEQKSSSENRSFLMLNNLLKRVGDIDLTLLKDDERMEFIKGMLTCDRKMALCTARQLSNDFDPIYDFNFEYDSEDPKKGKSVSTQTVDLGSGSFPFTPIKNFSMNLLMDKDKKALTKLRDIEVVLKTLEPRVFNTYDEVIKNKFIFAVLPKTGISIRMRMLDGVGEAIGAATRKEQKSSHTMLMMRNPCYQEKDNGPFISFSLQDLNKLPVNDLEFMRLLKKYIEGNVDTEIRFPHPEADLKGPNEKMVVVDLLTQLSFFFQSGTI